MNLSETKYAQSPIEKLVPFVTSTQQAECDRVVLKHSGPQGEQPVHQWAQDEFEGMDAESFAEDIEQKAIDYSEGMRGLNRYVVYGYRPNGRTPYSSMTFRIEGNSANDHVEETESASMQGLMAHMMRHDEVKFKMTILSMHQIIASYQSQIEEKNAYIRHLEKGYSKVLMLHEKLMNEQTQRDIDMAKEQRKDKFIQSLEPLGQAVAMRFLGAGAKVPDGLGGTTTMGENVLVKLMNSLSPEQSQTIFTALNPEQQAALYEYMTAYNKAEAEAKAKDAKPCTTCGQVNCSCKSNGQ